MIQHVAERANINDNIAHAAKLIHRSKDRFAVFNAIYYGRQEWKTATAIAKRANLRRKRVLEEGKKIVDSGFASQKTIDGDIAYSRDRSLYQHRAKVYAAARDKNKLDAIPTRVRPQGTAGSRVVFNLGASNPRPRKLTVDEIASFRDIRKIHSVDPALRLSKLAEARIKNALQAIIGETHEFKDWGGEKNDLYTNKLRVAAARKYAAFALKGKATQGTLTPKKMGANGDQVERLFSSEADVIFVVYHGKIGESVVNQMHAYAIAKSLGGRAISYGIIDGDDLNRLHQAYPD